MAAFQSLYKDSCSQKQRHRTPHPGITDTCLQSSCQTWIPCSLVMERENYSAGASRVYSRVHTNVSAPLGGSSSLLKAAWVSFCSGETHAELLFYRALYKYLYFYIFSLFSLLFIRHLHIWIYCIATVNKKLQRRNQLRSAVQHWPQVG